MKRILAGLVILLSFIYFAFSDFGKTVLSQNSNSDSYSVRVYNVDDLAFVYVNGNEVIRAGYKGTDQRYISNLLRPGKNEIRFVLRNNQEGYTYGFELLRGNEVTYGYECGLVDNSGCSKSTQTGIVFDRTVTINYSGGFASNRAYNAVNYDGRPMSNRVSITNTMANTMRAAEIAANTAANAVLPSRASTREENRCLDRLITNDIQSNRILKSIPLYVVSVENGRVLLKVVASGGSGYRSPISDRAMLAMSTGETPQQVLRRDQSVAVLVNFERQVRKMPRVKQVSWTADRPCLPGFVCQTTGGGFDYDSAEGAACAAYRK